MEETEHERNVKRSRLATTRIAEELEKRGINPPICNICGTPGTYLAGVGYTNFIMAPNGTSIVMGGTTMPNLTLVCMKCGHTLIFNALILGIGNNVFDEVKQDGPQGS